MAAAWKTFGDVPNPPLASSRAAVVLAYAWAGTLETPSDGPRSILAASAYMELYDEELDFQAAGLGLHTVPEPLRGTPQTKVTFIEALSDLYRQGIFFALIGDSREVSVAGAVAARRVWPRAQTVLLSGSLPPEGSSWSDADVNLRAIGLKSPPRKAPPGTVLLPSAREIMAGRRDPWEGIGPLVYLSIHPDFFEPAALPAEYNLEPGGLGWWPTLKLLRSLFFSRRVVGLDLSGHRARAGKVAPDFTLAKLLYKAIGYRLCPPAAGNRQA